MDSNERIPLPLELTEMVSATSCKICDEMINSDNQDHELEDGHKQRVAKFMINYSKFRFEPIPKIFYKFLSSEDCVVNLFCELCSCESSDFLSYMTHCGKASHKLNVGKFERSNFTFDKYYSCKLCCIGTSNREGITAHFKGSKHKKNFMKMLSGTAGTILNRVKAPTTMELMQPENRHFCGICCEFFQNENDFNEHRKSKDHFSALDHHLLIKRGQLDCQLCYANFSNVSDYMKHMTGKPHMKTVKYEKLKELSGSKETSKEFCNACHVHIDSAGKGFAHINSREHIQTLKSLPREEAKKIMLELSATMSKLNQLSSSEKAPVPSTVISCELCKISVSSASELDVHMKGRRHVERLKYVTNDDEENEQQDYNVPKRQSEFPDSYSRKHFKREHQQM